MVGIAVTEQENDTTYTCAICYETISQSSPDLLKARISRLFANPYQDLFVHRACLKRLLHSRFPLGEVFE